MVSSVYGRNHSARTLLDPYTGRQRIASAAGTGDETQIMPSDHVAEHSHVGESASNGLAERAVQRWENHVATLRHALDLRLGQSIDVGIL